MSGGSVPYHLRHHKAIDRAVFLDLLTRIGRATPQDARNYHYFGFAGPFSEDFKLIHAHLGIKKFTSIERNSIVRKRQIFNKPLRNIDYRLQTSRAFVDGYQSNGPAVVWLDYAEPRPGSQLAEVETLVSKLVDFDVLKVTFNASSHGLVAGDQADANLVDLRIEEARRRLGAYIPVGAVLTGDDVESTGYASLILKAAEAAVKNGLKGAAGSFFQPLSALTYQDSEHKMVTLTGIILPFGGKNKFLQLTGLKSWALGVTKWGSPRTEPLLISMPEMSLRERLFVDRGLPVRSTSAKKLMKELGFRLMSGSEERTLKALESYKRFYRYYPHFVRAVV